MWIAETKDGKLFYEGISRWCDVKQLTVIKLISCFADKKVSLSIPEGFNPICYNTGEISSKGGFKQLSQTIGYTDGKVKVLRRITSNGEIEQV